jgi:predicted cupin superfamily sugar epimerase
MPPRMTAADVVEHFALQPLAGEGGYFRQTWIAAAEAGAPLGTAILYLVTPDSWSALHRLRFDEVFHFYLGDPCRMVMAPPDGNPRELRLGHDILAGQRVQHVVPAGWWQGTQLAPGGSWALLGTTMAPGFHPDAVELASEASLGEYPPETRALLAPYLP